MIATSKIARGFFDAKENTNSDENDIEHTAKKIRTNPHYPRHPRPKLLKQNTSQSKGQLP